MKTAEEVAKGLSYEIALQYCKERHLYCPLAESLIPQIAQALTAYAEEQMKEAREKGFHEGKEFAILTIGNAITSEAGQESPFLAFSEASKALRR